MKRKLSRHPKLCRNNDQGKWQRNFVMTILPLSQHKKLKINILTLSRQKTALSRQKMERIQHKSAKISVFMLQQSFQYRNNSRKKSLSRQRKSYCDITFRVHKKDQQNIWRGKEVFCRDNQNMREVNSMSRQEVEKQHKRNGDKEIHAAT